MTQSEHAELRARLDAADRLDRERQQVAAGLSSIANPGETIRTAVQTLGVALGCGEPAIRSAVEQVLRSRLADLDDSYRQI